MYDDDHYHSFGGSGWAVVWAGEHIALNPIGVSVKDARATSLEVE